MPKFVRRCRTFLWWCAAADGELLGAPEIPRIDGIKYATLGAAICAVTLVGIAGWTDTAFTLLPAGIARIPMAVAFGLLMGSLSFCIERTLVVSVPANVTAIGKWAAFSWRAVIESFTATMLTAPLLLAVFQNDILARLDTERLALIAEKRAAVADAFGVTTLSADIEAAGNRLIANRKDRDQLPAGIENAAAQAASCRSQYRALHRALDPQILDSETALEFLERQRTNPDVDAAVAAHIEQLSDRIAGWKRALILKSQACAVLEGRFETGRDKYYAELDSERQLLLAGVGNDQHELRTALAKADAALVKTDRAINRRAEPDLWARVRALHELADENPFVRTVVAAFLVFFAMVDLMPIIAKLTSRSTYEKFIAATEASIQAHLSSEISVGNAKAEINAMRARAELEGVAQLCRDGRLFVEFAKSQVHLDGRKAEVVEPLQCVEALLQAYDEVQGRLDDLATRYRGRTDAAAEIEQIRKALHAAVVKASGKLGSGPIVPDATDRRSGLAFQKLEGTA